MGTSCTHPVVLKLIQQHLGLHRSTSHGHGSSGQTATDPGCCGFLSFAQNDQLESKNIHFHYPLQSQTADFAIKIMKLNNKMYFDNNCQEKEKFSV